MGFHVTVAQFGAHGHIWVFAAISNRR